MKCDYEEEKVDDGIRKRKRNIQQEEDEYEGRREKKKMINGKTRTTEKKG